MAAGDAYVAESSVAAAGVLDVQPAAGAELVVHTIFSEADIELQWFDGTNILTFDAYPTRTHLENLDIHCTNSIRLRVKNTNAAAKLIGVNGIYTK